LVGLLSHLDRKNAEKIAAFVDVERLVIQEFIGTAPWLRLAFLFLGIAAAFRTIFRIANERPE